MSGKQTVLVTGASGGLGLELARCYAKDGARVILVARREDKLQAIAEEFRTRFRTEVIVLPADLTNPQDTARVTATIQGRGLTVDVLVNNAGFGDFGDFADSDIDKQQAMIDLNVKAVVALTHAVLPAMREKRCGTILNVASIAAFQSGPYMAIYYATKAFVLSFSEALATELKGSNITVTTLCPGPIKTGFEDAADLKNSKLFRSLPVATAQEVAQYGYRMAKKGKTIAIHGALNKLLVFGVRFAPRKLVSNMIVRIQGYLKP